MSNKTVHFGTKKYYKNCMKEKLSLKSNASFETIVCNDCPPATILLIK